MTDPKLHRSTLGAVAPCSVPEHHHPHAPEVVDRHHILPQEWGGASKPENLIALCPNHHRRVHELLDEYVAAGGEPPWSVRQHYGKLERELAARGWQEHTASSG